MSQLKEHQSDLSFDVETAETARRRESLKDAKAHMEWLLNEADPEFWYYPLDMKSTKLRIAGLE